MPRPIKVVFTRHADRSDKNKTGLTRVGLNRAKAQGAKRAIDNLIVKRYSSLAKRSLSTATKAQKGYVEAKGKPYVLRTRKDITTPVPNKKEWQRIVREDFKGNKQAATIAWLRGKIPGDVVLKPELVISQIIKKRIGLGKRIVRFGAKDIMLENFTHQELMLGIFEMLTGQKVDKLSNRLDIGFVESFEISLYKNGKATLKLKNKNIC